MSDEGGVQQLKQWSGWSVWDSELQALGVSLEKAPAAIFDGPFNLKVPKHDPCSVTASQETLEQSPVNYQTSGHACSS